MPIVFAAIGSGRPKPSRRRSANTLRMFSNPAGFVCNLKKIEQKWKRIKIPRTKILRNP